MDGLFLLEVNTQPGMTPLSLVPEQARHIGMSYPELVQAIVDEAMRREGGGRAMSSRTIKRAPPRRPASRSAASRPRCRRRPARRDAAGQRGDAAPDRDLGDHARCGRRADRVAPWFGCPARSAPRWPRGSASAGFRVEQIEVTGLKRMDG